MKNSVKKDNKTLRQLFLEDQQDRNTREYEREKLDVANRDTTRRKRVRKILRAGGVVTAGDHYHAALIFQHGNTLSDFKLARTLASKSVELSTNWAAKWLYAAATDRYLVLSGKKQKFGTQYRYVAEEPPNNKGAPMWVFRLFPTDQRTSDQTRARYGVPPMKELISMECQLTRQIPQRDWRYFGQ